MMNQRINLSRLALFGVFGDEKKPIKLVPQVRKGYPRFNVWLPEDPAKEMVDRIITIPFTFKEIISIPSMIEDIADDKNEQDEYVVVSLNNEYRDGKRTDNVVPVGKTIIKRDSNGVIHIVLEALDRPVVSFPLLPDPKYFKMLKNGIEITSHKKMSEIYAKAYAKTLAMTISQLVTQYSLENDRQDLDQQRN